MADVIATGTAVNSNVPGLGPLIEKAMVDAINKCYANGITDAESILAAKLAAFERVKSEYANVVAAALTSSG